MTTTLSAAITTALHHALETDPKVLVMGQDVGGLGGVFRVTDGLQKDFGPERVLDTPIAEAGIVGTAIGLAQRGYRPVCEIQFDGFVYPAFNQITSQLAKMHARSRGRLTLPVVIRIPVSGGIGAVEHHSESNEAYFAHTAGLRVVAAATPQDAHWLLRQAIESEDPVIFFEPKCRYWSKGEVAAEADLALDAARTVRPGADATLLTWGSMVETCLAAAAAAEEEGHDLEVIDLRSLSPVDVDALTGAVARTGRAVVVHEAPTFGGLGGEVAATLAEHCFDRLEAPVLRVGGFDAPYPAARLESHYRPDLDRVLDAVDRVLTY
ncbi:alpha-ketoacid dehydrogenase subunit beta [Actinomycetospora sp. NBRC 106378]|uniref:alpha-ketoacid dehydrogenase subunit beta n=1 Tax=Actinomycetospora sp. NBRC 106378 TaxID=3032208 RepID=UPI0024A5E7AD|nr:alpha-ketoacid dehydrogenase subunit beta [Actinomycetospora sp. NBRC 106378]GLZ53215.1 2-oxoisovalerate dehydrogenase subunit beta [Actinomycetospora sp. NBRC 106378]